MNTCTTPKAGPGRTSKRYELLRALGAVTAIAPPDGKNVTDALGLPPWDAASHTQLFVTELPPYASIHLGSRGWLGGEGAERIGGVWRALGLDPPADADHLCSLLALYAHLGEAALGCRTSNAAARLDHTCAVILHEHLSSWVPGYLTAALATDPTEVGQRWVHLLGAALHHEVELSPPPATLAAALNEAPPPVDTDITLDELLDACVAPLRVGFILTWTDLHHATTQTGLGLRRGERRFALRSMVEQDPHATLRWLAEHARRWAHLHTPGPAGDPDPGTWWQGRARTTASVLDCLWEQTTPLA